MREQKNYHREKVWPTADEHTMESVFFEPPMETKIGAKNWRVREIRGKQSGIVIRFDNLDQNKPLTNRCANFRSRDIIW